MKSTGKIILSLTLIIIFLIACGILMTIGYAGFWLHTYKAFTQRRPVAEVTLSEQKEDENGPYVDVTYRPIQQESAFVKLIARSESSENDLGEEQIFKLYGDTVHIGGPIVKFRDELILFNFDTIYKTAKIFGRYNIDNELEINRNEVQQQMSSYDLNEGIDESWKAIHDSLTEDNFQGKIYRQFIDTTQLDVPGQFASNKEVTYTLYITNAGFLWVQED